MLSVRIFEIILRLLLLYTTACLKQFALLFLLHPPPLRQLSESLLRHSKYCPELNIAKVLLPLNHTYVPRIKCLRRHQTLVRIYGSCRRRHHGRNAGWFWRRHISRPSLRRFQLRSKRMAPRYISKPNGTESHCIDHTGDRNSWLRWMRCNCCLRCAPATLYDRINCSAHLHNCCGRYAPPSTF